MSQKRWKAFSGDGGNISKRAVLKRLEAAAVEGAPLGPVQSIEQSPPKRVQWLLKSPNADPFVDI